MGWHVTYGTREDHCCVLGKADEACHQNGQRSKAKHKPGPIFKARLPVHKYDSKANDAM